MLETLFYKLSTYLNLGLCSISTLTCVNAAEPPNKLNLNLPAGFEINIVAKLDGGGGDYFTGPRMLAFDKNGNLFVSLGKINQIIMLPGANIHAVSRAPVLVSNQLNAPNGLAFVGEDLLVANQDGVVKLSQKDGKWSAPQPFISGLASGGHTLKTLKIGPDNFLYINVGSSCNVCVEEDATRATILRYTLEGKPAGGLEVVGRHNLAPIWASGLRNSQGFAWHPKTGSMFATNNGADMRSDKKGGKVNDELPLEHFNKIEPGQNYGWPHCWGDGKGGMTQDPNFPGANNFCKNATPPAITFTSHSTPIGVTFLDKTNFPSEYKNDAIVALHGSWNRAQLSGYKLVRVKFNGVTPVEVVDFATGWLNNNEAWGRPVDVVTGPDGALYVSDDRAGYIYRIHYKKP
ncbi:MAG: PQQ-dependent sugar dehydrogenase [Methylotenera sp.]